MQELAPDPNSPWQDYCGRGPITKNQVAALLRDYDIRPVVVHPTERAHFSRHGYRAAQFEDAFAASCPTSKHPNTQARARGDVMFGCLDVYHWMGRAAKVVCLPDSDVPPLKAHFRVWDHKLTPATPIGRGFSYSTQLSGAR